MIRIASFNVENLFARPNVFDTADWDVGEPYLNAYYEVNHLMNQAVYTPEIKQQIKDLLLNLEIYYRNDHNAVRRSRQVVPDWAWLRKNRGSFDSEPRDATRDVEIIATGRDSWIGWVELAKGATDEEGTRTTARVIRDVDADILAIVGPKTGPPS